MINKKKFQKIRRQSAAVRIKKLKLSTVTHVFIGILFLCSKKVWHYGILFKIRILKSYVYSTHKFNH